MAANVPGADLIPDTAELFLGFTSTQRANLGPGRIANLETLGYTDAAGGYFHGGTHMHVSHIFEDLEAWYLNFDFQQRVDTTFRPGLRARQDAQTVAQGPARVTDTKEVERDFRRRGRIGHSSSIQTTSRLERDTLGPDGTVYRKGTAIPQRADFNTLDNPFFWSAHRAADRPRAVGRRPLRRLQPVERRLPPQSPGDGRGAAERDATAARARVARPGPELGAADHAPAELPRAAAAAPFVSS